MNINLSSLFGQHAPSWDVTIPCDSHANVPTVASYTYTAVVGDVLRWWFAPRRVKSLFLVGPTGCGKTSLITQLCANLNWPLFVLKMNATMRPEDMEGIMVPESRDGTVTLRHVPGDAIRAYREGGCLLLDEGNRAHPSSHTWLNALLEGYPIRLAQTNETIVPHENFRLLMAGNAGFLGDQTGLHPDCNPFCVSFQDRLRTLRFGYPEVSEEVRIFMSAAPSYSRSQASHIVRVGQELRKMHEKVDVMGEALPLPFSVRTLEDIATAFEYEYADAPISKVFDVCFANGMEEAGRHSVQRALALVLNGAESDSLNRLKVEVEKPSEAASENDLRQIIAAMPLDCVPPDLSPERIRHGKQSIQGLHEVYFGIQPSEFPVIADPQNWQMAHKQGGLVYAVLSIPVSSGGNKSLVLRAYGGKTDGVWNLSMTSNGRNFDKQQASEILKEKVDSKGYKWIVQKEQVRNLLSSLLTTILVKTMAYTGSEDK